MPWCGGDGVRDLRGVHEVVVGADVDEDGGGTGAVDGHHCRRGRVGDGDDLVTGADAECLQPQLDGVGAVVDTGTVANTVVVREVLLEAFHAGAEHQLPGAEDGLDGVEEVRAFVLVFRQVVPDVGGHGELNLQSDSMGWYGTGARGPFPASSHGPTLSVNGAAPSPAGCAPG